MSTITRRIIPAIAIAGTMMLVATGCVAGENAKADAPHLHFAIFKLTPEQRWWEGTPIDPYPALTRQ